MSDNPFTKQQLAELTRKRSVGFWGRKYFISPVLIDKSLGDGKRLLALQALNTRPNYYIIRVDSKIEMGSEEWTDYIDDITNAIEEEVGRSFEDKDSSPTGRAHYLPWPAYNGDSGCSWWEVEIPTPRERIERAFQRAMNIRDSTPGNVPDAVENRYSRAYRRAYRHNYARGFTNETRRYLKAIRSANPYQKRGRDFKGMSRGKASQGNEGERC